MGLKTTPGPQTAHRLASLHPDDLAQFKVDPHPPTVPHTAICSCGHKFNAGSYHDARLCWQAHAVTESQRARSDHVRPRAGEEISPGVMLVGDPGPDRPGKEGRVVSPRASGRSD